MAFVLAFVILGWLVAFALAAQEGFESEPATTSEASPAVVSAVQTPQAPSYSDPMSAA